MQNRGSSYIEVHANLLNSAEYALTSGGTYSVVSRIDNTLVLCTTPWSTKGLSRRFSRSWATDSRKHAPVPASLRGLGHVCFCVQRAIHSRLESVTKLGTL